MSVTVLERELYTEAAAARLLGVAQNTLNYWLEGGERRGRVYRPVIRVEPRGSRAPVTWGEFLESALLRQYRGLNVPMLELRDFIDKVREKTEVPYPLAHLRPYVGGRELLVEAQNESGLEADYCLIAYVRDQPVLTPPAESFVQRVTWDGDIGAGWRPHEDSRSPVLMDPKVRFGLPAVDGIRTGIIWEHRQAGETDEDIAAEFEIPVESVEWALAYERSAQAA
ncbi:MAG: DUF433 domain-containing protein [Actinomycetota bacterium]|nr:DUF433 domain-containing protein [Actinomycetota bacterium]